MPDKLLPCSHCPRNYEVKRGSYRYCLQCEQRFALKDIEKDKMVEAKKEQKRLEVIMKKVRVKCWHCGFTNQKILSYEKVFSCDKCQEELWTGDGGFTEKAIGVWT